MRRNVCPLQLLPGGFRAPNQRSGFTLLEISIAMERCCSQDLPALPSGARQWRDICRNSHFPVFNFPALNIPATNFLVSSVAALLALR